MTYRGHVRNGAVVLDDPAVLPEGAAVEVRVIAPAATQARPITSLDELRGLDTGEDPFHEDFEQTLRKWRNQSWRASPQEPVE
jgi:hypothetical protein